jgi:hypothetical protein
MVNDITTLLNLTNSGIDINSSNVIDGMTVSNIGDDGTIVAATDISPTSSTNVATGRGKLKF